MYSRPGYTCLPLDTRIAGTVLGGLDDSTRLLLFARCVAFFTAMEREEWINKGLVLVKGKGKCCGVESFVSSRSSDS
jgi:hypothetical protein